MKSSFFRGIARLPTRISVWTAPGLSMTMTRRVGGGGSIGAGEGLFRRDVADDRQDGVVRAEPLLVEREQIGAGQRGHRLGRPGLRPAVGMEAVNQPVEDDVGEEIGVVVADLHARQRLLPLPLDLLGRKGGVLHEVRHQVQRKVQAVLHDDRLDVAQVRPGAGAHGPADRVDRVGDLFGRPRGRALVEQRRRERGHAGTVVGILRGAGAHEKPQADRGLLVMRHRDHLEPVRERLERVGRELHLARLDRPRRPLRRPVALLRGHRHRGRQGHRDERSEDRISRRLVHRSGASRGGGSAGGAKADAKAEKAERHFAAPFGRIVITVRFSGVKYVRATRCTSATDMFWKMSNSPSAVLMSP